MNLSTLNLESLFPDVYKEIHFDNFSVQITENNLFRLTKSLRPWSERWNYIDEVRWEGNDQSSNWNLWKKKSVIKKSSKNKIK